MRLTLRTLLAYLDDALEPSQALLIGQKVAESEQARELITRIKTVTRRRRLMAPPVNGSGAKLDANTIAEYVDNELPGDQLAEVEERLAAWNVPFIPTADNVTVDSGRRNDLLLRLSLAGAPHSHLSSTEEALGSIGVLSPQAVVEAQTRAGLAGDIEAGLRGIDGVDDARVIVVPSKGPEFADQSSQAASASVRLRLRARTALPRATVDGIRAFVAGLVDVRASIKQGTKRV